MFIWLKYKITKLRVRMSIAIKIENDDDSAFEKMSNFKRRMIFLKSILIHPIKYFNVLIGKEFNIKYIEFVLTTACTLNCKGCSALMCYYKKSENSKLELNIKTLDRILSVCNAIKQIRLLGGEPLCYPNLYEMLDYINKQDKIKRLTIVTNGTLLIKDDRIIEILKNKKFDIFISNYGENSYKYNELIKQLEDNNIKYETRDPDVLWRDYGDLEPRNRSEKQLRKQFANCTILCNSIFNGNIHHCPRSTHGTYLNKIKLRNEDYINILDQNISDKDLKKKLYKFFYGYVPYVQACDHCNSATSELKLMPAGEQLKK